MRELCFCLIAYDRERLCPLASNENVTQDEGGRAKRRMLAGRRDPTLIFGEGYSAKRYNREADAIVGAQDHMWIAGRFVHPLLSGTFNIKSIITAVKRGKPPERWGIYRA